MHSSRSDNLHSKKRGTDEEPHNIKQLGLDFISPSEYYDCPRKEIGPMNQELIEVLEKKISDIVEKYSALKSENSRLREELQRFSSERDGLKSRVDSILSKLEGI